MKFSSLGYLVGFLLALGVVGASCDDGAGPLGAPAAVCPDGLCAGGETAESCPADCAPAAQCGDGVCDQAGGECSGCPEDCPASACEACGNGVCLASAESCASCAEDCGDCMACRPSPGSIETDLTNAAICDFLDPARCLLPFPNDYFLRDDVSTTNKKRVNLALEAMPKNILGVPVRPEEYNRGDGWSPVSTLITRVEGAFGVSLDPGKSGLPTILDMGRSLELDSPIVVVDAETGERHPVWAELDVQARSEAEQPLLIRPGKAYKPGRRYVVGLRNLVDEQGNAIEASPGFRVYRDCLPAQEAVVEARRGKMESVFLALAKSGVKRSELYLAWDFTVASHESLSGRALHMRDQAFAELGDSPIRILNVQKSATPNDPFLAFTVSGTFLVPSYLSSPLPSARLVYGADGKPAQQPVPFDAEFTCIVPKSATGSSPSRIALYGHQTLSSRQEVTNSNVERFAFEHNVTLCATDWVGLSEEDLPTIGTVVADISNFPALTDRLHQALLNFLYLGRLMKAENGLSQDPSFRTPEGQLLLDTSELYYFGEDQGGSMGVSVSALAQDWKRAVLSLPGIASSIGLTRASNGKQFMDLATQFYPHGLDVAIGLQLVQLPWDSTEASGYVERLTRDPFPDTPAKQVLLHEAFGDHTSPNVLTELLARSLGVNLRVPALAPGRSLDKVPFFGLEPIPGYPHAGSALFVWDAGAAPPDPENRPPSRGLDPHGAPGASAAMRAVTGQFMGGGGITDVCGGVPCTVDRF